jgi:hypothetical protein
MADQVVPRAEFQAFGYSDGAVPQTLEGALCAAVAALAHKKFGIAALGIGGLIKIAAPAWMIVAVTVGAIVAQLVSDLAGKWLDKRGGAA